MKLTYLGLVFGVTFAVTGLVRIAHAANPTGSCKLKANFAFMNGKWELVAASCSTGSCPSYQGHSGVCREYQSAGGVVATYTCACRYEWTNEHNEPVVHWEYSAQVCDGYYKRDAANGNALVKDSHYCSGPCDPQLCKVAPAFPASPVQGSPHNNVSCACQP